MKAALKEKIEFPDLDGLRFFSFFLVFLSHSIIADSPAVTGTGWYKHLKTTVFSGGEIGVSFFFVLSGFLITYLLLREKQINGKIDVPRFYFRRALRIWPLYYFVVIFGFKIFPLLKAHFGQVPHETADPVLCSTFLNNFDRIKNGEPDSSLLGVLWSVAIEEQFYLFWPLLFFFIPSKGYRPAILLVILGSVTYRFFFRHDNNTDYQTAGVISDMAMGGLGAELMTNSEGFRRRMEQMPKFVVPLAMCVALLLVEFNYAIFSDPVMFVFKRIVLGLIFITIILGQSFCSEPFFRIRNSKLFTALGKRTYGLYCLHGLGILISLTVLRKFHLFDTSSQMFFLEMPLSLLCAVAISGISFRFLETPFLRLKKRFSYIVKE